MRHAWKNAARLEKFATLRKMRHIQKNAPPLEKYSPLGKMRQTWKMRPKNAEESSYFYSDNENLVRRKKETSQKSAVAR